MDSSLEKNLDSLSLKESEWFRDFFIRNFYSLVSFARNYVQDHEVSRDIIQDIFFNLMVSEKKFDSAESLKAYMYQSIRNTCIKYIKHEKVKDKYLSHEKLFQDSESSYLQNILEQEVYQRLLTEIDNLPKQCRNVYLLVIKGKKNQEIAEILNINIETVKSHKQKGKNILKDRLKDVFSISLIFWLLSI